MRAHGWRRWGLTAWAMGVGLLTACDESAPADGGAVPTGALVLGTGETAFEPLEEGQEVPLVAGSQGGYHFWLSLQVEGLVGPRVRMELTLTPEGPAEAARSDVRISVREMEGQPGWSDYIGWPARVLEPWCAVGQPVQVDVRLEDAEGHVVSARTEVVPTPPEGGFGEDCGAQP